MECGVIGQRICGVRPAPFKRAGRPGCTYRYVTGRRSTGMLALLVTVIGMLAILAVVTGARALDAAHWRQSLVSFELRLPSDQEIQAVSNWLASVAALTHAPRGALLPQPPVVLEVLGTPSGVSYILRLPGDMEH